MQGLVVVSRVLDLANGRLQVASGGLGADHEANLARGIGGDGGVGIFGGSEDAAGHFE